ncbi:MAG: S-layer homology domain-containing protein [Bacillota bacterium]
MGEFVDALDVSPWATEAMGWAVRIGLVLGKPGRRIDPNGTATRAEVATIIHRLALSIAVSGADPMN